MLAELLTPALNSCGTFGCCLALLCVSVPTTATSAGAALPTAPRLSIGSAAGAPGTDVTVVITLSGSAVSIVTIAPLVIGFHPDVLAMRRCEPNPAVSDGKLLSASMPVSDRINLVLAGDLVPLPDGDIIDCMFTINPGAVPGNSTALTFEAAGGSDAEFHDYALAGIDGAVVITGVPPTPGASVCTGDCNGDGQVSVDEILSLVSNALGLQQRSICSAGDRNGDGEITIDEILIAIHNALNGCPDVQP